MRLHRFKIPLLLFSVFLVALLSVLPQQSADPDLWGRLSVPALYFQTGRFPDADVFSFTAFHAPWTDHEWLSGFVFYEILIWTKNIGLQLFKYLMMLCPFILLFSLHNLYQRERRQNTDTLYPWYAFYGLILLAPVYGFGYCATIRCQVFSFFFFVLFIWILEHVRLHSPSPVAIGRVGDKTLLLCLPFITVLWGNLHGGVTLGILLIFIYGVGEGVAKRSLQAAFPYWVCTLASLVMLGFVNPYGWHYIGYLIYALTLNRQYITEWKPLPFNSCVYWEADLLVITVILLMAVHLWSLLFVRSAKELDKTSFQRSATPFFVIGITMLLALKSLRFQPFFAFSVIAFLPYLIPSVWIRCLRDLLPSRLKPVTTSVFTVTLPCLIGLSALWGTAYLAQYKPVFTTPVADELEQDKTTLHYPVAAIRFLKDSPYHGRLMNPFTPGEFLYWNLYPQFLIALDGRYEEVYSQQTFFDIHRFYVARPPVPYAKLEGFLNQYHPDLMLLPRSMPLLSKLTDIPEWLMLYGDNDYVILGRTDYLAKFPAFTLKKTYLTEKRLTINDFFTAQDLKRFSQSSNGRW